jgi:hypothetical protein
MSEWQPIKTAPRNCDVLILCPGAATKIIIGILGCDGLWYEQSPYGPLNGEPLDVRVLAWMPLPEPP